MTVLEDHGRQKDLRAVFHISRMSCGDVLEAAFLEQEIFPDPWSEKALASGLSVSSQLYFVVRDPAGRLAGYAAAMMVLDEGELLRIGVLKQFQRQGVASVLLEEIFRTADEKKLACMLLEVRQGNIPAIRLYEKYGFLPENIRKNYYREPKENALTMRKNFLR